MDGMLDQEDGAFVTFHDYENLDARLAAIKEENERLHGECDAAVFELCSLKARVADQSAYILRLRKAIIDATNNGAQLDSGKWVYGIDDSVLQWPEAIKEPANEG
jgi:hypothetical protein